MPLKELLSIAPSRSQVDFVAGIIAGKPDLFEDLWEAMFAGTPKEAWRAAWVADTCSENDPELIRPYLRELAGKLPSIRSNQVRRHATRILARSPLDERDHAVLINTCFDWLMDKDVDVAVKVHCMDILYRVSQAEPEIRQELFASIEYQMPEGTPGFCNRGRKIMSLLMKEMDPRQ